MPVYKRLVLATFAVAAFAMGSTGAVLAGGPQRHVIEQDQIQARIDQQVNQADADRQAVQTLLQRADVRRIAGSAGLDLKRASASAAVLSGPLLENVAAQAREVNATLAGGDGTIVISASALIIILLLIIILTR